MKMRRSFLALLLLTAACLALACPARAQTLALPSSLKTIADEAFWHNTSITSAVVPDGAERIGARAFAGCTAMTEITLPATVIRIAKDAFAGCEGLTILCDEDCYAMQYAAEHGISARLIQRLPEGLLYTTDETHAVITGYTGSATRLRIPKTLDNVPVTEIQESAFTHCSSLISVTLPDSIETLGAHAFAFCENLSQVNYPRNLSKIDGEQSPFEGCPKLVSMTIPHGVTSIPPYCFQNCDGLSVLSLPDGLLSIGAYAFNDCDGLVHVHLPDTVETLSSYTFGRCDNLAEINYPANLKSVGVSYHPFWDCPKLTSIVVPEGVTSIPKRAFYHCDGLESVYLPSSVETIGYGAFSNCQNLTQINYPLNLSKVDDLEPPFSSPKLTSIVIPEGVTSIPDNCFDSCRNLRSISLPSTLKSIGKFSFSACTSLISIQLPDSVETIGEFAFASCPSLIEINYPASLKSINGYNAPFDSCSALTRLIIPDGVTKLVSYILDDCPSVTDVWIPNSVESIGRVSFGYSRPADFTIHGVSGSYAEQYASAIHAQFSTAPVPQIPVSLSGRVTDSNDQGIAGITVIIWKNRSFSVQAAQLETDADGSWLWNDAAKDATYYVHYALEGYTFSPNDFSMTMTSGANDSGTVVATPVDTRYSRTIKGHVQTESGVPIAGVQVLVEGGGRANDAALTNSQGNWAISYLDESASYTLHYVHQDYTIPSQPAQAENLAIGALNLADNGIGLAFSMRQNGAEVSSIIAGTSVDFTVDAPGAAEIRLVVDGVAYESYVLDASGHGEFSRVFSTGGDRQVAFQAMKQGETSYGMACDSKPLSVSSLGKLAVPIIEGIGIRPAGQSFTVSWSAVDFATQYNVYLYRNGVQLWPNASNWSEARTTGTSIEIPGSMILEDGTYTLDVVTTGINYTSSTGTTAFEVRLTDSALAITYPKNANVYHISDYIHTKVACYDPDLWIKLVAIDANGVQHEYEPDAAGVFYPTAYVPGTYQLTAYASTVKGFTLHTPGIIRSETVTVTVDPPAVLSFGDEWQNDFAVVYSDESIDLQGEVNCLGAVEVFVDDVSTGVLEHSGRGDYWYTYSVQKPSPGKHMLGMRVKYNGYASETRELPVYSVLKGEDEDGVTKYMKTASTFFKTPDVAYPVTLTQGQPVVLLGTYGDSFAYVRIDSQYGFVASDALVDSIAIDTSIVQRVDATADHVVFTASSIVYTVDITDSTALGGVAANVAFTSVSGVTTETTVEGVLNPDQQNQYIISIPVTDMGVYRCSLQIQNLTGEQLALQDSNREYISVLRVNGDNGPLYRKQSFSHGRILYQSPIDTVPMTTSVTNNYPMTVLGAWGTEWAYVRYAGIDASSGEVFGFVKHADTQPIANTGNKRAYILIASDMWIDDRITAGHTSQRESSEWERAAMAYVFQSWGIPAENICAPTCVTTDSMQSILNQMCRESTVYDTTYVYLTAHGDPFSKVIIGNEEYKDNQKLNNIYQLFFGTVSDKSILKQLRNVKGNVVLIIDSCYGGNFCKEADSLGILKNRLSIISSVTSNRSSVQRALPERLISYCTFYYNDSSYMKCDTDSDGIVHLSELRKSIGHAFVEQYCSESGKILETSYFPDFWGDDNNIVVTY